jgi:hypothetical protein
LKTWKKSIVLIIHRLIDWKIKELYFVLLKKIDMKEFASGLLSNYKDSRIKKSIDSFIGDGNSSNDANMDNCGKSDKLRELFKPTSR